MRQRVKIVIKEEIVRELYAIAGEDAVQTAEPMKNHTTFRVGGPADYFVAPHTEEEIRKIVALCEEKEIPWFVTGNGSNLVVSDEGYHGVILSVYKNFQGIEVEGNRIRAKAGSMLVSISRAVREAGLSGMEFASGIPGTLGGGVRMNAGAYGGVIEQFQVLEFDRSGNIWLSLSILDVSPNQGTEGGVRSQLLNYRTGEVFPLPTPEASSLSGREREILRLISRGKLSKEIADQLNISVHTVNTHRQHILEKLNADNSMEAVRYASARGLLA